MVSELSATSARRVPDSMIFTSVRLWYSICMTYRTAFNAMHTRHPERADRTFSFSSCKGFKASTAEAKMKEVWQASSCSFVSLHAAAMEAQKKFRPSQTNYSVKLTRRPEQLLVIVGSYKVGFACICTRQQMK